MEAGLREPRDWRQASRRASLETSERNQPAPVCSVLKKETAAAAAALLPNTMGNILTGFTFFIPKYGLRSKENFSLSSPNLMWMPGQNHLVLIVIFAEFF